MRRTAAIDGVLRLFPAFLLIAAASVCVSRGTGLEPALLLGPLATVEFLGRPEDRQLGRTLAATYLGIALVSVLGWVLRAPATAAFGDLADVACTMLAVSGTQAVVFNLIPIRIFHGHHVFRWSRVGWAVLQVAGTFAMVHVLLHGATGGERFADRTTFLAALFAVYLLVSVAFSAAVTWLVDVQPRRGLAAR